MIAHLLIILNKAVFYQQKNCFKTETDLSSRIDSNFSFYPSAGDHAYAESSAPAVFGLTVCFIQSGVPCFHNTPIIVLQFYWFVNHIFEKLKSFS